MYSEKIAKVLESQKIGPGDTISIDAKGEHFEGELMPKTEAGSEDTLVLKLKNGYNIGIEYTDKMTIKKTAGRKAPVEFPFAKPKHSKDLPNVTIIWTGGTIGSKISYGVGGVAMTVKAEELLYYVPELAEVANISLKHLFSMSSEDMGYQEWQKIAEEVAKELNNGARGVVITHGTDTMHYTAAALSFMLKNLNSPVVLTGSQRSTDRGSSDGFTNLTAATRIAANSDIAEVGIVMHATSSDDKMHFIRGTKAKKMHTSRRDAFRPINDKAVAYVTTEGAISYTNDYKKAEKASKKVEVEPKFEHRVALVKTYPNSDPGIIDYYVGKGYKGIIIEGTGLGHTPVSTQKEEMSWLPHIKNAVEKKLVVGVTSQCTYGRVHANVYKNLRLISGAGAIYCEDMTPETALVKLGWLLGNHTPDKAKELMGKNIAGEINDRITFDEFLM